MAIPEKPHRRLLVSRLHWVLPLLHSQLLTRRTTPTGLNKESDPMGLGRSPNKSLRNPKSARVHETSADPTAIRQAIRTPYRCIGIWRGHHTLTRGRYQPPKTFKTTPPSHRLLLSNVHPNRKELQHLRARTSSGPESPTKLETTPRMDAATVHPHHGSRQPHILETPSKSEQTHCPMVRRVTGLLVRDQTRPWKDTYCSQLPLKTLR